jgi:hypothetical protein
MMTNILTYLKALTDGQAKTEAAKAALEMVAKAQGSLESLKAAEQQAVDDLNDMLAADGYLIRTGHGLACLPTTTSTTTTLPGNVVPPAAGGIVGELTNVVEEAASRIPS